MGRGRERGVIGIVILVVMLVLIVGFLAAYVLSRITAASGDATDTMKRLAAGAEALEKYAGTAGRLPCPADPAADTGDEVTLGANDCQFPEGTLPWKTIAVKRDYAFDTWGQKISYRVYINAGVGSLTQPRGVNMVECDLVEGAPVLGANATCNANADVYQRNTLAADFLAGKGLTLTDLGTAHADVAFVLVSHGLTGLGAWTASGVQRALPAGDERNNARATGPFTIKAFSDADVEATAGNHFDDLLVYRTLPELVRRANLAARDWPEGATLNAATLQAATGSAAYGDRNQQSFSFMGNTFGAFGGSDPDYTFVSSGGYEGIGVAGDSSFFMTTGEFIRVDFNQSATRLAITLLDFGHFTLFSTKFREQARFRFFSSGTQVGTAILRQGCRADGGLASFLVQPSQAGASFNRVEVEAAVMVPKLFGVFDLDSAFLISEVAACGATAATCITTLQSTSNLCDRPSLNKAFSPASVAVNVASTLTFTLTNGTDNAAHEAIAFTDTLPGGLVVAAVPNVQTNCPAGGGFAAPAAPMTVTAAAGAATIAVSGASISRDVASCQLRVSVSSAAAGAYANDAGRISATANLVNSVSAATLTVTP